MGGFVRVPVGQSKKTNQMVYRLARIVGGCLVASAHGAVARPKCSPPVLPPPWPTGFKTGPQYRLRSGKFTDVQLRLQMGKQTQAMRITFISDSRLTGSEVAVFHRMCREEGEQVITDALAAQQLRRMQAASKHQYKSVRAMRRLCPHRAVGALADDSPRSPTWRSCWSRAAGRRS